MGESIKFMPRRIWLTCEPSQPFFVNINSQWLKSRYEDVQSEVELMRVDQQRVVDVARNNTRLILVNVMDIICDVNPPASRHRSRLYDPNVLIGRFNLEFIIMHIEIRKLFRQAVSVRDFFELFVPILFLHFDEVLAKLVLASHLVTAREVVDLLKLIQAFVHIRLATGVHPEDVPVVAIRVVEPTRFQNGPAKFGVAF
jgi:hypothetical protein